VEARAQRDYKLDGSRQRSWHTSSGLLVCRFCGSKLTIEGATGRSRSYKYFSCRGKKDERSDCPGVRWRADILELALEKEIISVIFSQANFRRLEKRLRAYRLKLATRRTDELPQGPRALSGPHRGDHRRAAGRLSHHPGHGPGQGDGHRAERLDGGRSYPSISHLWTGPLAYLPRWMNSFLCG
jgi:hypothetical protein